MNSLVSIIIPVYNRSLIICETLDSIINQSYTNWECIVVDDDSTDNTLEVLHDYKIKDKRFKVFSRPKESVKGASTCRNIGLYKAVGDYVVFLDSDDTLLIECLENRVLKFQNYYNEDFLIFPMGVKQGDKVIKKEIAIKSSYLIEFLSYRLSWSIMCPIWNKEFLINLNGFSEGYQRLNDPELMIRALLTPNVKFKIFNEENYDTIYYPSITNWTLITDKYFETLELFIPDICKELKLRDKLELRHYLRNYLKVWFTDFMFPSNQNLLHQNRKLIELFYKHDVISLFKTFRLKILLYSYILIIFIKRKLMNSITKLNSV